MNYAVTELNDTTFNLYSALLAISGILLAVTAATGFGGRSARRAHPERDLRRRVPRLCGLSAVHLHQRHGVHLVLRLRRADPADRPGIPEPYGRQAAASGGGAQASATGTPYAGTPYASPGHRLPQPAVELPASQPGSPAIPTRRRATSRRSRARPFNRRRRRPARPSRRPDRQRAWPLRRTAGAATTVRIVAFGARFLSFGEFSVRRVLFCGECSARTDGDVVDQRGRRR